MLTERERGFHYLEDKYNTGAREVFEALCADLFIAKYGDKVHRIRVHHGDGGIDTMVGDFSAPVQVIQCKFFLNGIGDSQRSNIRQSFRAARENPAFRMKEWILCLPLDLSLTEMDWWSHWKADQEEAHRIPITLLAGSNLLRQLTDYGLYDQYFDITLSKSIEDIRQKLDALLHQGHPATAARATVSRIATILDADTISQAEATCTDTDAENFYLVDTNFQTMLRVVSAGRDDRHSKLDNKLLELCQGGKPVILVGHGGTGKSTAMLRTVASWVRSGQLALWVSFSGTRAITDAEAGQFYQSLLQIIPAGQRALLCLDNPSNSPDSFGVLANHWPGSERLQLALTDRVSRLSRMTNSSEDLLYHWFDGATVLAMLEEHQNYPLHVKNYPVEYFPDLFLRRKAILGKIDQVLGKKGGVPEGFRKDTALDVLREWNSPKVSLVELIYRATFALQEHATMGSGLRMDWDEWAYMLKRELKIKKSATQLYGVIALCSFYGIPMTTTLFCRFFGLEMLDFGELISNWKMNRHVEPVIYNEQNQTLHPKHDIVAELFFLFHREFAHNDIML